jgi:predicted amidohydrolase
MKVRVAAVAWKLRSPRSDSKYFGHLHDFVSQAHDEGAEIIVFPELHSLELLPLGQPLKESQAPDFLAEYASGLEDWYQRISESSGLTIVGGSHFREEDGEIYNTGVVAYPNGLLSLAAKNNLTVYERDVWDIKCGAGLQMSEDGIGVSICYDSEFPNGPKALAEAGTKLLCVPAWTETQRGFQRVRWSCLARAVENQFYVVHSSLLGGFGEEPVPFSYGSSAIIAPSVEPFPPEAILRETELNEEGLVIADLDFDLIEQGRTKGEVTNWQDRNSGTWSIQKVGHAVRPVGAPHDFEGL